MFDCEADGFLGEVTKVHCIGAVDVDTGQFYVWGPNEIGEALKTLHEAEELIGHNIIRYDLPVLYKLHRFVPYTDTKITDTMVMARVAFPNRRELDIPLVQNGILPAKGHDGESVTGKHTLEAWGYRLGEHKQAFDGPWAEWSQTMQDYMMQDVRTNYGLYKFLIEQQTPEDALDLEHRIQGLCDTIEKEGCPFDVAAAGKLQGELAGKREAIAADLRMQFEPWLAPDGPKKGLREPKRKPNKNQEDYFWWDAVENEAQVGDDGKVYPLRPRYAKLKRVFFNPGSRDHAVHVAQRMGWKPNEFTEGGSPKMDETIAAAVAADYPEFAGLAEMYMLTKRLGQLAEGEQAWLKHCGQDGVIHGVINPMGCVTSRASHFNPNLGQVPATKKPYGKECRGLFRVKSPWWMVGADQDGLELRALAHYLALTDDGEYAHAVTSGDPHWLNAQGMGLVPMGTARDKSSALHTILRESGSKRFIYAYVYGCGDEKAGRIILSALMDARRVCGSEGEAVYREWFNKSDNPSPSTLKRVGKRVRSEFASRIRGFSGLKQRIARQVEKHGYVPGLDGRRIPVRSAHAALNYMIQGAGAIICKRWGCDAFDEIKQKWKVGWNGEVVPILWVHDEYQYAVREGIEHEVGDALVRHARSAGEPYGFRCPLNSKYTSGRSWAETH